MKQIFAITLLFCVPLGFYAQTAMLRSEMPDGFRLEHIPFDPAPASASYTGFSLAINNSSGEFILYGEMAGDKVIFIEKIPYEFDFYPAQFSGLRVSGTEVKACSAVPGKTTEICGSFLFDDETLTYQSFTEADPSPGQVTRATAWLTAGSPLEALAAYDSVKLPESYYVPEEAGAKLLEAMYTLSTALQSKRKFKDAADGYAKILAFHGLKFLSNASDAATLETKIGKGLHGLTYDELATICADYVNAVYKNKAYDQVFILTYKYKILFPGTPEFLLAEGDTYYAQKDEENARKMYKEYVEMMKSLKRQKDIPLIVEQRIAE